MASLTEQVEALKQKQAQANQGGGLFDNGFDLWAATRKFFGDKSADVYPELDNVVGNGSGGIMGTNARATGGSKYAAAPSQPQYTDDNGVVLNENTDFGYGGGAGYTAADTRALYDDQINDLNRLLGVIDAQSNAGLESLRQGLDSQRNRLMEQRTKTMSGYDAQTLENAQNKQRGVESVDSFANNSFNSLQRLLGGANAGNSSVARELVPYLVSKSAGQRRTGVFDTAGRNEQAITSARGGAEDEFRYSEEDLNNQAKQQESNFRQTVLNQQNDLLGQRRNLEIQRGMANGQGYQAARQAAASTDAGINDRTAQLTNLFSQFKPTFTARAMNLQTPELSRFTVDPAQINADRSLPAESSYYQTQLRKRREQMI